MFTFENKKVNEHSSNVKFITVTLNLHPHYYPEKRADIGRRNYKVPHEMLSEKRAQKFHADDASLSKSVERF